MSSKAFKAKVAALGRKIKFHRRKQFTARREAMTSSSSSSLSLFRNRFQILPDRLKTVLESSYQWYVPATNMSAAAGNYTNIMINSIYQPFNAGYPVNTGVNTYSMHGSPTQGYSGVQNPIGYNQLAALYTLYKVIRLRLRLYVKRKTAGILLS